MKKASLQRTGMFAIALTFYAQFALSQIVSGLVEGRVICNDGNVPARGAEVRLIPLGNLLPNESSSSSFSQSSPTTTSDFNGLYSFPSVAPGTYIVNATMAGYIDGLQLARTTLARYTPEEQKSIVLAFPQVVIKVGGNAHQDLIVRRGGAISGKVSVDSGGTTPQSRITATRVDSDSTLNGNSKQDTQFSQSALTDDRGVYRIAGLPKGEYRVSVRVTESYFSTKLVGPDNVMVVPQRTGLAELTVFAPEAPALSDASLIKVAEGDEVRDIDISIPTRLLHSLAGTVTRGGEPLSGVSLSLETKEGRVAQSDTLTMPNGTFQFDLLPDGNYTLIAKTYSSGRATSSARVPIQIHGSDIADLVVDIAKAR